MKTVICNNRLCGKEYNVKFDNCPFCGTPNPMNESERKKMTDDENEDITENGVEDKQFNGIVIGLIWISIFFFGIRGIMSSFTNMIFSPGIGCLTLVLSIIGIVSLYFILRAKKWALFLWIAYRLTAGIVNGSINSKFDSATNIIIAIANIGLMILILQIRKNGVSAWSLIFKNHGSCTIEENINPTLKEGTIGRNTFSTSLVDNNNETHNVNNVYDPVQDNDIIVHLEETHTIKSIEGDQVEVIPTTETQSYTKKVDNQDKATTNQIHDKEETKQKQERNINSNKWANWCIIGLLIAILAAGIWFLAKPCKDNPLPKQIDSMPTEVFDCGLFSFEYPSSFKPSQIQNSPHMVFKAVSDTYYLTASYWDYGFNDNISIWDDKVYELYKQMPVPDGSIVEVSKETIKIKDEHVQCLKIKTNERPQWHDDKVGLVYYLLIHDGYLFTFAVGSNMDTYYVSSATPYPDQLMGGLKFKATSKKEASVSFENSNSRIKKVDNGSNSANDLSQKIHDELEKSARDYNRKLPENIGYDITMTSCTLEGYSMVYTIKWVGLSPSDFSAEDIKELKKDMIDGLREEMNNSISRYTLNMMRNNGYDFIYKMINEKGEKLCSIRISPSEI